LKAERARLMMRRDFLGEALTEAEERRFAEISDLTLADADLWDDLVPEDPPRAQRPMRSSRKPGRNEPRWCGSGRNYKHGHLRTDEAHELCPTNCATSVAPAPDHSLPLQRRQLAPAASRHLPSTPPRKDRCPALGGPRQ